MKRQQAPGRGSHILISSQGTKPTVPRSLTVIGILVVATATSETCFNQDEEQLAHDSLGPAQPRQIVCTCLSQSSQTRLNPIRPSLIQFARRILLFVICNNLDEHYCDSGKSSDLDPLDLTICSHQKQTHERTHMRRVTPHTSV